MPTQCSRDLFGYEVVEGRQVVAAFDGGEVTSDAGALLLGATDRAIGLVARFAACFTDGRAPAQVEHTRRDHGGAAGVRPRAGLRGPHRPRPAAPRPGAGDPRRQAHGPAQGLRAAGRQEHAQPARACAVRSRRRYNKIGHDRRRSSACSSTSSSRRTRRRPSEIILDLDATDDPLHGHQDGRFFHGYTMLLLSAAVHVLRRAPARGQAAALEHRRLGGRGRGGGADRRPDPRALAAGEDRAPRRRGLCPRGADGWCEANGVDYVFGLARNERLVGADRRRPRRGRGRELGPGRPGAPLRRASTWRTLDSWSRQRRVVAKAEHLPKGANPRFVVTSLPPASIDARTLYEDVYCARGEMENRIKEQQLDLFADRTSAATMRANQLRLWFASIAYVLLEALAPHRPAPHPVRHRHLRHDPAQAPEDRRPGAHQRAPHQGRDGVGLPVPDRVPPRLSLSAARRLLSAPAYRLCPHRGPPPHAQNPPRPAIPSCNTPRRPPAPFRLPNRRRAYPL